jgi:hypothetical protein
MTVGPWPSVRRLASSKAVDIDDSLGKGLRSFLRQIVPDTALYDPMRVFSREFIGRDPGVDIKNQLRCYRPWEVMAPGCAPAGKNAGAGP